MREAVRRVDERYGRLRVDRASIPQQKLDVAVRERISIFPWRGQFSPGLVNVLLGEYARRGDRVLDPFVGSGTTLYEGARQALRVSGSEVNPAAWLLASFAELATLDRAQRKRLVSRCSDFLASFLVPEGDLLSRSGKGLDALVPGLSALERSIRRLVSVSILLAMGDGTELTVTALRGGFERVVGALRELPATAEPVTTYLCDARRLPIPPGTVDLILTSPPYINVFNYHQNYRPAVELLGWKPLEAAPSEFGANRKHRGNRFLTVVQYAMDMAAALGEMRRLLRPDGRAVLVIGRESRVRGLSFQNGRLLGMLAMGAAGFEVETLRERSFVSRFGGRIFEEIIVLMPSAEVSVDPVEFGRAAGVHLLQQALPAADAGVRSDLEAAIEGSLEVRTSPMFLPRDGFAQGASGESVVRQGRRSRVGSPSKAASSATGT